jgi:hypothetical protein
MEVRRITRLTNGNGKDLAHHEAAVALFVSAYNLTRVHSAFKCTPAMACGIADHVWSIAELVDAAQEAGGDEPAAPVPPNRTMPAPPPVRGRPQFTVIQGGRA